MDRRLWLLALGFALAGCSAPRPTFDPFAAYGQTRVPAPPTGAIGQPNGYYQPPSYSPPGYTPPGSLNSPPYPPPGTAPSYQAPSYPAAPGYAPPSGYPSAPSANYPYNPNAYPPAGGLAPSTAPPGYPASGGYPATNGYSNPSGGYPASGYPASGYPASGPSYRPPASLPPLGQNSSYGPLAPQTPASVASRAVPNYGGYTPWSNNRTSGTTPGYSGDGDGGATVPRSSDFEQRGSGSPASGSSAFYDRGADSSYIDSQVSAAGFRAEVGAENSGSAPRRAGDILPANEDDRQVSPTEWNPLPRDNPGPSTEDYAAGDGGAGAGTRPLRIRGFANSGIRSVRIPDDVSEIAAALQAERSQQGSYDR